MAIQCCGEHLFTAKEMRLHDEHYHPEEPSRGGGRVSDCAHVWIYHPGTEMEWRCIRCQAIDGPLVPPSDDN